MISDADINHAAKELIERHGADTISVAQERVAGFSAKQDQPGMNVALRVLSAIELLIGSKASRYI